MRKYDSLFNVTGYPNDYYSPQGLTFFWRVSLNGIILIPYKHSGLKYVRLEKIDYFPYEDGRYPLINTHASGELKGNLGEFCVMSYIHELNGQFESNNIKINPNAARRSTGHSHTDIKYKSAGIEVKTTWKFRFQLKPLEIKQKDSDISFHPDYDKFFLVGVVVDDLPDLAKQSRYDFVGLLRGIHIIPPEMHKQKVIFVTKLKKIKAEPFLPIKLSEHPLELPELKKYLERI